MGKIFKLRKELKELGYTDEDFETDNLSNQAHKFYEKLKNPVPQRDIYGYPSQEMRKGRPYYYLQWFTRTPTGKRVHHKKYLGTTLPKGYKLGSPVKIATAGNRCSLLS